MRIKLTASLLAFLCAGILIFGCSRSSSDSATSSVKNMSLTKMLGVYGIDGGEIRILDTYGEEVLRDSMDGGQYVQFKIHNAILIPERFEGFVVNLPDAKITESKVYFLPDIDSQKWYLSDEGRNPKPLHIGIEPLSGTTYKITISDNFKGWKGYLALFIQMPLGTADRLYPVMLPTS